MATTSTVLAPNELLRRAGRLPRLAGTSGQLTRAEWATLIAVGGLAGLATSFLTLELRIPGHAILRGALPMAAGLALVPRRGAGTIMGLAAVAMSFALSLGGVRPGHIAALASVWLLGPLLDVALTRARAGWQLYAAFAVAGVGANVISFGIRIAMRYGESGRLHPRALDIPLVALASFAACGAVAGLVSAACCFRLSDRRSGDA